jgi:hypothetical protein
MVIGNTLEETSYHEAGHIVIAGAVGLDLKPKGVVVYEVEHVADGWAFYWEDKPEWDKILLALGEFKQTTAKSHRISSKRLSSNQFFQFVISQFWPYSKAGFLGRARPMESAIRSSEKSNSPCKLQCFQVAAEPWRMASIRNKLIGTNTGQTTPANPA